MKPSPRANGATSTQGGASPRPDMPRAVGPLHDALAIVVDRIYRRDPERFRKLVVWVKASLKTGWLTDDLRNALLAFDARDTKNAITDWWPWLNAARQKARTMRLQSQHQGYTPGELNHIKTILAQIGREIGNTR